MEKILTIGGKQVGFRASARMPRLYRNVIGRDIMRDLNQLQKSFQKAKGEGNQLQTIDLEIFENAAWCMAKLYDNNIPDSPDDWLDQFDTFSIYEILPQILELWAINQRTTSTPKNA